MELAEQARVAEENRIADLKALCAKNGWDCATITPRCGCFGWKPRHEQERQKLNRMIRESKLFDGVIDFDQVLRDQRNPEAMDMRMDSGDHLHPGVIGGIRIAERVKETIFAV